MLDLTKSRLIIKTREDLIDTLRMDLYSRELDVIASYIGVHISTLYAIRSGRTKWPRHGTLMALIQALGYHLELVKE